jgi:hypothetical protein
VTVSITPDVRELQDISLYYPLNPQEHFPPDDIFFEITGVLEVVTAYFVGLFTLRLIRDRRQSGYAPSPREKAIASR